MTAASFLATGALAMLGLVWLREYLTGFSAQRPRHYAGATPRFDMIRHLNGPMICDGVIYGPTGRVASRFTGRFNAEWTGNRGVMTEHFIYDSGETQDRAWHLELGNDGAIRAEAADVEGTGQGRQSGPTVQLRYRLRLPLESGGHVLDANDWMYLAPNGTIVNRSQFRKFGIKVAELVATMRRVDAS